MNRSSRLEVADASKSSVPCCSFSFSIQRVTLSTALHSCRWDRHTFVRMPSVNLNLAETILFAAIISSTRSNGLSITAIRKHTTIGSAQTGWIWHAFKTLRLASLDQCTLPAGSSHLLSCHPSPIKSEENYPSSHPWSFKLQCHFWCSSRGISKSQLCYTAPLVCVPAVASPSVRPTWTNS